MPQTHSQTRMPSPLRMSRESPNAPKRDQRMHSTQVAAKATRSLSAEPAAVELADSELGAAGLAAAELGAAELAAAELSRCKVQR